MICVFQDRLVASIFVLTICFVSGCGFDLFGPPTIVQVRTVFSPNRQHKVIICRRGGGTTTDFSTSASVIKAEQVLQDGARNLIFAADSDHSKAPRAAWGGPDLEVEWISDNEIKITHHEDARIFIAETNIGDIKIQYHSW